MRQSNPGTSGHTETHNVFSQTVSPINYALEVGRIPSRVGAQIGGDDGVVQALCKDGSLPLRPPGHCRKPLQGEIALI